MGNDPSEFLKRLFEGAGADKIEVINLGHAPDCDGGCEGEGRTERATQEERRNGLFLNAADCALLDSAAATDYAIATVSMAHNLVVMKRYEEARDLFSLSSMWLELADQLEAIEKLRSGTEKPAVS